MRQVIKDNPTNQQPKPNSRNKYAIASFVLPVVTVIIFLLGVKIRLSIITVGPFLFLVFLYLGIRGLKSTERKNTVFSILGIMLSIFGLLVCIYGWFMIATHISPT